MFEGISLHDSGSNVLPNGMTTTITNLFRQQSKNIFSASTRLQPTLLSSMIGLSSASTTTTNPIRSQTRHASSDIRPKKSKFKKAMKGFYPSRSGGSIRGTNVFLGDYGLQVLEGGRVSDTHFDVARSAVRRALKNEKGSQWWMRAFPDRPVTSKPAEVRMGKGKGYVDFYATWVAEGRMLFEVKGTRPELALKALKIAGSFIPLRTRVVARTNVDGTPASEERIVPPRVLPYFIKHRLAQLENRSAKAQDIDAQTASKSLLNKFV